MDPTLTPREHPESSIPLDARIRLGHAMVQGIADEAGIDLVHIKGYAVAPGLYRAGRVSTDVDIWVRPSQVDDLVRTLAEHHWRPLTSFRSGSIFEHAAVSHHLLWGYVDIHRVMPGVGLDPEEAFNRVWAERQTVSIADYLCTVPAVEHQRAIIILHEARSGTELLPDVDHMRQTLSEPERLRLRELAASWQAEVAWAAATGRLEEYRDHPEYPLWKAVRTNATGTALLWARVRTERRWLKRAELIAYAATPNMDHLRLSLHREPTIGEIAGDLAMRWAHGFTETRQQLRQWARQRRRRRDVPGGGEGR